MAGTGIFSLYFLFITASGPALRYTQPSSQWVTGDFHGG